MLEVINFFLNFPEILFFNNIDFILLHNFLHIMKTCPEIT